MTVIVAARTRTGICIAADSQTTIGWAKQTDGTHSKLWSSAPYAFGAAGSVRAAQVVQHFTAWPRYWPGDDVERFLVREVAPAIITATETGKALRNDSGVVSFGTSLLIAWGDNLAQICSDGSVLMSTHGRMAIGSGEAEALGYLGTDGPWTVKQVCEAARRATITANGCDGAIDHVTTQGLTVVRGKDAAA